MAAKLGLTAAPGYALGRTYDDFGFEPVVGAGHAAFGACPRRRAVGGSCCVCGWSLRLDGTMW